MNVWGDSNHHLKRQFDRCTHFHTTMQPSHTAWNTHRVPVAAECHLYRARHVATQQSRLKPGELYHLGGPTLLVVSCMQVYICQKSLNFTYTFKCYQQNCSWLHFTWPTLYVLKTLMTDLIRVACCPWLVYYHRRQFLADLILQQNQNSFHCETDTGFVKSN